MEAVEVVMVLLPLHLRVGALLLLQLLVVLGDDEEDCGGGSSLCDRPVQLRLGCATADDDKPFVVKLLLRRFRGVKSAVAGTGCPT